MLAPIPAPRSHDAVQSARIEPPHTMDVFLAVSISAHSQYPGGTVMYSDLKVLGDGYTLIATNLYDRSRVSMLLKWAVVDLL